MGRWIFEVVVFVWLGMWIQYLRTLRKPGGLDRHAASPAESPLSPLDRRPPT